MKKLICVLCTLVMALLPVLVMAEGTEVREWKETGDALLVEELSRSMETWKSDEAAGFLVTAYSLLVMSKEGFFSENSSLTMATENVYVGEKDKNVYIIAPFPAKDDKTATVIKISPDENTWRYLLMEVENIDNLDLICEEYCGQNYWPVTSESLINAIYSLLSNS